MGTLSGRMLAAGEREEDYADGDIVPSGAVSAHCRPLSPVKIEAPVLSNKRPSKIQPPKDIKMDTHDFLKQSYAIISRGFVDESDVKKTRGTYKKRVEYLLALEHVRMHPEMYDVEDDE